MPCPSDTARTGWVPTRRRCIWAQIFPESDNNLRPEGRMGGSRPDGRASMMWGRRQPRNGSEPVRAVVHDRYGSPEVLHLAEVERPVPGDDDVLVKVHASTVNRTDCGFRRPRPFFVRAFSGLRRPKHRILGSELAGEVAAIGAAVTEFAVGDHVFGVNPDRFGTNAEFVCMRADAPLAHKPAGLTFEEAAAICDGGDPRPLRPPARRSAAGAADPRLRRLRIHRHGRRAAGDVLRCPRHSRVQHEERRHRAVAGSRRGRRLHA